MGTWIKRRELVNEDTEKTAVYMLLYKLEYVRCLESQRADCDKGINLEQMGREAGETSNG